MKHIHYRVTHISLSSDIYFLSFFSIWYIKQHIDYHMFRDKLYGEKPFSCGYFSPMKYNPTLLNNIFIFMWHMIGYVTIDLFRVSMYSFCTCQILSTYLNDISLSRYSYLSRCQLYFSHANTSINYFIFINQYVHFHMIYEKLSGNWFSRVNIFFSFI